MLERLEFDVGDYYVICRSVGRWGGRQGREMAMEGKETGRQGGGGGES